MISALLRSAMFATCYIEDFLDVMKEYSKRDADAGQMYLWDNVLGICFLSSFHPGTPAWVFIYIGPFWLWKEEGRGQRLLFFTTAMIGGIVCIYFSDLAGLP